MEKGNVANLVRYQTKKTNLFFSSARCIVVVLWCQTQRRNTKPASIEFYNSNKCGVDLLDSMARMHSTKSPMRRWPMAVWCNILDLAGVNAWILFSKETGRKISRWDFIHTLALDLINPEIERRRQIERPSAGPGCNVSRKRRNCAVRKGCKNNKTMETCRKCCKAMCGRCQALICIDCGRWQCLQRRLEWRRASQVASTTESLHKMWCENGQETLLDRIEPYCTELNNCVPC